jgi:hypothetical protein
MASAYFQYGRTYREKQESRAAGRDSADLRSCRIVRGSLDNFVEQSKQTGFGEFGGVRFGSRVSKARGNHMRYLSIYKTAERATPPSQEEMATMGKLIEEAMKAGWLIATEGCMHSALGARVRRDNEKVTVTDGPFTESKEVVGGFAILQANSKEEAVKLAKEFLDVAQDGECELRQLYEVPEETCVPGAGKT